MKNLLRSTLERRPPIASTLRALRDEWHWNHTTPSPTPYGFLLGGHPAMQAGSFEPEEVRLVSSLLPHCDLFIDVGAFIGLYTCLALKTGRKVIAFEPLPANVRQLLRNIAANQWDAEVWPIAVGRNPGIANLYGSGTGASIVPGWAGASEVFTRLVPMNTLDNVLGSRFTNERILVKMDVEGLEYAALLGASTLLQRRATWLVEVTLAEHRANPNPNFMDTFELFWRTGYKLFTADGARREVTRDTIESLSPRPTNWLFIPAAG